MLVPSETLAGLNVWFASCEPAAADASFIGPWVVCVEIVANPIGDGYGRTASLPYFVTQPATYRDAVVKARQTVGAIAGFLCVGPYAVSVHMTLVPSVD